MVLCVYMYVCRFVYVCGMCLYLCVEWCVCASTYISKKISVYRCLDPSVQRIAGQHPWHLPVCASQFTEVWRKGWGSMTYQSS